MNFSEERSAGPRIEHGRQHHKSGDLALAESIYRKILEDEPDNARALHLLGLIAGQTGNADAAVKLIERSIAADPADADAQSDLGNLRLRLGDAEGAEYAYRSALEIDPAHAKAAMNLGVILREQGCHEENVAMLSQVVRAHPHDPRALNSLGAALVHAGEPEIASDYLLDAAAIDPGNGDTYNNLGLAYHFAGRFDEAIGAFTAAIARNADFAEARWNRVITWMQTGAWRAGLSEWHWRRHDKRFQDRALPQPLWDGVQLFDEPVLVTAEQGIGDQILFASLLPLAEARGVRPILECEPRLVGLLGRSFADIEVIAKPANGEAHPLTHHVGLRTSVIDLAQLLPHRPERLRVPDAFLRPDLARRDIFKERLRAAGPGPYIGISWRSGNAKTGAAKSIGLDRWEPIFTATDATFVNLQYGDTDEEIREAEARYGVRIYSDPELDRRDDLDGLAALASTLDLVITTNNATAPIAAGLGVDTWTLVRQVPLWYWGAAGTSCPFLPSARLFRQKDGQAWQSLPDAVGAALRERRFTD